MRCIAVLRMVNSMNGKSLNERWQEIKAEFLKEASLDAKTLQEVSNEMNIVLQELDYLKDRALGNTLKEFQYRYEFSLLVEVPAFNEETSGIEHEVVATCSFHTNTDLHLLENSGVKCIDSTVDDGDSFALCDGDYGDALYNFIRGDVRLLQWVERKEFFLWLEHYYGKDTKPEDMKFLIDYKRIEKE